MGPFLAIAFTPKTVDNVVDNHVIQSSRSSVKRFFA
jgi:hypothetical protein